MSVLRVHIRKALTAYNDLAAVRHLVDISGVRGRFKHKCWSWGNLVTVYNIYITGYHNVLWNGMKMLKIKQITERWLSVRY